MGLRAANLDIFDFGSNFPALFELSSENSRVSEQRGGGESSFPGPKLPGSQAPPGLSYWGVKLPRA